MKIQILSMITVLTFLLCAKAAMAGNSLGGGVKSYAFRCNSKAVYPGGNSFTVNIFDISNAQDESLFLAEVTVTENGKEVTSYTKMTRTSKTQYKSLRPGYLKIAIQGLTADRSAHTIHLQGKKVPFADGLIRFVTCDRSDIIQ